MSPLTYPAGELEAFSDWGGTKSANRKSKVEVEISLQSESTNLKIY